MTPRIGVRAALAIAVVALTAACNAGTAALTGRDFFSVAATDGGAPRPLIVGTRINLYFREPELTFSAGCNSMGGTYRLDGDKLVVGAIFMTEIGCDPEHHAQDEWLATFLGSKPTVRLVGSDLWLDSGSVVIRLIDREVAEPDLNLAGPTWTVESIIEGDAVSSVPAGAAATFVFNADGSLELSPGCNRGGGSWKLQRAGIEITDVVMTKMACDGPQGQLESSVLQVLRAGGLNAAIDGKVLTLQGAGGGLQLRGG